MVSDWHELSGDMTPTIIEQALDDNGDGIADDEVWQAVLSAALSRVRVACSDAMTRHPDAASYAMRMFCCESLWTRRGFTDEGNPFRARATAAENRLRALASGDESDSGDSDAVFIGEPAKIAGLKGLMA